MSPNTQLILNDYGMLSAYMFGDTSRNPLHIWTYDDFQVYAGPYKITPSVYTFLSNWVQGNIPLESLWSIEFECYRSLGTESDAVQAYFCLPFIQHEIMHTQMMTNLEMTRSSLVKMRHEYILADLHLRNMEFPKVFTEFSEKLVNNVEHKIRIIERDITEERQWSSYY